MSITATNMVASAASRISITAAEEVLSAADGVRGLQLLNEMLFGFGSMGIQYTHSALIGSDTVNVPDEQIRNVTLMLCSELADDWDIVLTPKIVQDINNAKNELQAYYLVVNPAVPDRALRSRRGGWFDFNNA